MLPYCLGESSTYWDCARGCMLGIVNLIALLVLGHAISKVAVIYQRTRWHGLNLVMLSLAGTQCMFAVLKYIIVRSPKLTFMTSFVRAMQSMLTCSIYSKMACDNFERPDLFRRRVIPVLFLILVYLTVVLFVAVFEDDLPCHHPNWLLVSSSQLIVNGIFVVSGIAVMKELQSDGESFMHDVDSNEFGVDHLYREGQRSALSKQRHLLWVLLMVNAVSALIQIALDSWQQSMHHKGQSCEVLEHDWQEIVRMFLKLFSYDLPVMATYYVFYWYHRHTFDRRLDINLQDVLLDEEPDRGEHTVIGEQEMTSMDADGADGGYALALS